MRVLIVIPAYNEEENISKVIRELRETVDYDILVINDSSTDNTKKVLEELNVNTINNVFNLGYSHSIQTGIKYAYENDYDYVITFDGDTQHIASYIPKLLNKGKKANIVIGSRYLKKEYKQKFFRYIGTKLFSFIIKVFCKTTITDPLSGMQCLDKKVIKYYATMNNYPEYPDANLIIEMLLRGYKITEVPVKMRYRTSGISMHSGIIKPIKYMISMIYTIVVVLLLNRRVKGGK